MSPSKGNIRVNKGNFNARGPAKGLAKGLVNGLALGGLCAGLAAIVSVPAYAAEPLVSSPSVVHTSEASVYSASFFSQYSPQNALEMIQHLPGFSFDQGSNERGFGGNAGNVLINGSRPTSKSSGLRGALVRIPAEQVVRIEILRGGVSGGEAAGQSIVANVIRSTEGTSGTWALKARQTAGNVIKPNLEAAISTQIGEWDTTFDTDIGAVPKYRTATVVERNQFEELDSAADEVFRDDGRWIFVNGEGSTDVADGKFTINGRIGADNWQGNTQRDIFNLKMPDDSVPDEVWTLAETNKLRIGELGLDWAKTSDQWKLRLIGLGSIRDTAYEYHYNENIDGERSNSTFAQDRRKTEFVGRATYSKVDGAAFKPEFGIEIANNELDTDAIESEDGVFSVVSGADVIVQEWRAEIFTTFSYEMSDSLSIEGGVTAEFSQIEVTGGSNQKQTFQFIKPRLSSTYEYSDDIRLTFELEHEVGQLDFNDFSSSSEAADDRTIAGNPDLAPDQTTEASAKFDWSFSERGSINIGFFHEWQTDILEQIVLSVDEDGVENQGLGNAGDARFWGMEIGLSLPVDWVIPHGLLDVSYGYANSVFDDPVTGPGRALSGLTPDDLEIDFRQDLSDEKIAWGIGYQANFNETSFQVDEVEIFRGNKRLQFFIETTRFFGVKTQLEVTHLNNGRYTRSRYFFDGNRAGAYEGNQVSSRKRRPEFKLTFSGGF